MLLLIELTRGLARSIDFILSKEGSLSRYQDLPYPRAQVRPEGRGWLRGTFPESDLSPKG